MQKRREHSPTLRDQHHSDNKTTQRHFKKGKPQANVPPERRYRYRQQDINGLDPVMTIPNNQGGWNPQVQFNIGISL